MASFKPSRKLRWRLPSGNTADSVSIPGGESRTLELAFQPEGQGEGCWVATEPPAYLPPGIYRVKLTVKADNARPVEQKFEIFSPMKGEIMRVNKVD